MKEEGIRLVTTLWKLMGIQSKNKESDVLSLCVFVSDLPKITGESWLHCNLNIIHHTFLCWTIEEEVLKSHSKQL